jgi:hypothetical protein
MKAYGRADILFDVLLIWALVGGELGDLRHRGLEAPMATIANLIDAERRKNLPLSGLKHRHFGDKSVTCLECER